MIEKIPTLSNIAKAAIQKQKDKLTKLGISCEEMIRPVRKSTFNELRDYPRTVLRCGLLYMIIRELPIKNFFARSMLGLMYYIYVICRFNGRLLLNEESYYANHFQTRNLYNYPMLKLLVCGRLPSKDPPVMQQDIEWRLFNNPCYY